MKVSIVLTFPDDTPEPVAVDVAAVIAAVIISDVQSIANGGWTAEETFGPGSVAPSEIQIVPVGGK